MRLSARFASLLGLLRIVPSVAAYTWPSPQIDELEDIMYLQYGYASRGFSDPITPCTSGAGPGRYTTGEWIRSAFHDVANYDAAAGTGGMDASLMFELEYAPNIGNAFNQTFLDLMPFYSIRSSMSDLLALSAYAAVRACGGLTIPFSAGRVDAVAPGPNTGPVPTDTTATLTSKFAAAGNNVTKMIRLTACGHSFGGVHGADFPQIVGNKSIVTFDTTPGVWDNRVVAEFIAGNTSNPLVVGPEVTNSDKRVYESDGNTTMQALLSSPSYFAQTCAETFTDMINTVAKDVALTDPFSPIGVKPSNVQLTLNEDGSVSLAGQVRLLTTGGTSQSLAVSVSYADRTGRTTSANKVLTTLAGTGYGFDDSFNFYNFSTMLPSTGISQFNVDVSSPKGLETYDNNGGGFLVQDDIFFQAPQSCLVGPANDGSYNLTVFAAVRDGLASDVTLRVVDKIPQRANISLVAPRLQPVSVPMQGYISNYADSGYDIYAAGYILSSMAASTTFDVFSGTSSDSFKQTAALSASCRSF